MSDSGLKRLGLDGTVSAITSTGKLDLDIPSVTPDGRFAVIAMSDGRGGERNLWAIALTAPYAATRLFSSSAEQSDCLLSPDGRWLMWHSVEGGREANFLARFMTSGAAPQVVGQRVSLGEGEPLGWRGDGREIYMLRKRSAVIAIPVTPQADTPSVGSAVTLFTITPVPTAVNALAVVPAPDGNRFVVTEAPYAQLQTLHVLTNWSSRLPRR